jgi:hypothetical protein
MNKVFIIVVLLLLLSCKPSKADDEVLRSLDRLHTEVKALKDSLQRIQKELIKNSTVLVADSSDVEDTSLSKKDFILPTQRTKKIKQPAEESKPTKTRNHETNDTTYHYFDNKRLSVKIAPRSDIQKIWIYLKTGELIQEYENIRMSYQVSHDIHFRGNGSIHQIKVHFNPGASRYWYTDVITFDEYNMPLQKVSNQHPADTMEAAMGKTYFWDNEHKSWVLITT